MKVAVEKLTTQKFKNRKKLRLSSEDKYKLIICDGSIEGGKDYTKQAIHNCLERVTHQYKCPAVFLTMNEKACREDPLIHYSNFAWSLYSDCSIIDSVNCQRFTYLGGISRPDKITVVSILHQHGLLDKALWSFGYPRTTDNIDSTLLKLLPRSLDNLDFSLKGKPSFDRHRAWRSINYDFYRTRFSLVQETEMCDVSNRYTEKTFKCLVVGHPFIVAGNFGVLQLLRKDGFETFSPYIDETYDQIRNKDKRAQAVVSETQRLCNLTDFQWKVLREKISPILEHNHNHAKTMVNRGQQLINSISNERILT